MIMRGALKEFKWCERLQEEQNDEIQKIQIFFYNMTYVIVLQKENVKSSLSYRTAL